jgi:hypothetical protein
MKGGSGGEGLGIQDVGGWDGMEGERERGVKKHRYIDRRTRAIDRDATGTGSGNNKAWFSSRFKLKCSITMCASRTKKSLFCHDIPPQKTYTRGV